MGIVAIITVFEFPPSLSLRKCVNLLFLYCIFFILFIFLLIIDKFKRDLLIEPDSLILSPFMPALFCLSEPTKSTIRKIEYYFYILFTKLAIWNVAFSIYKLIIEWLFESSLFINIEAVSKCINFNLIFSLGC